LGNGCVPQGNAFPKDKYVELFFETNVSFQDMDVFPTKMVMLIGKMLMFFLANMVLFPRKMLGKCSCCLTECSFIKHHPHFPKEKKPSGALAHLIGCQEFACLCL